METKAVGNIKQLEKIAKALGDRSRLMILQTIACNNSLQCMELMETVDLSQPTISHHIKTLVDAGIVNSDKEGRCVNLTINQQQINELITFLNQINRT